MRKISRGWVGFIVGVSVACTSWGEQTLQKPAVLDDALGSIVVSDVHGFFEGVGSVAAKINPMMSGALLKQMLGSQIGDPQLEGIPAGKGLAVVALSEESYFAVVELADAKVGMYTNLVSSMGVQTAMVDDLMVVAMDPATLQQGVAKAKQVEQVLLAKRSPSLRIGLKPSVYMDANSEDVEGMLAMLPMLMAQSQSATNAAAEMVPKIVEAEVRVLLSLADQLNFYEVELLPQYGDLLLSEVLDAKKGTALDALLSAPAVNSYNPKLQAGLLGDGAIELDMCMLNPDAFMTFVELEALKAAKAMDVDAAKVTPYLDFMKKKVGLFGGTLCESVLNGVGGKFGADYIVELKDEAGALEMLRSVNAEMDKMGILDLYKSAGLPMSIAFKEAVRSYKDIPVHELLVDIDYEKMNSAEREQLEAVMGDMKMELVVAKGVMVYSTEAGKIDAIIDQVLSVDPIDVTPLDARGSFAKGGFCYMDVNLDKYMGFLAQLIPDEPEVAQMAALFQGTPPITTAGFRENGLVQMQVKVPGDLVARIGQMVMMAQMQQQQGAVR